MQYFSLELSVKCFRFKDNLPWKIIFQVIIKSDWQQKLQLEKCHSADGKQDLKSQHGRLDLKTPRK